jgi:hypothetical protein
MNRRRAWTVLLLAAATSCTFLEAFEITYGDGKYKIARITTEMSIPDLADLGTLSEAELAGQVAGLPADRSALTLAHVQGALRLAGTCELQGTLRQGVTSGQVDAAGSLFTVADCAADGRCDAACPEGPPGLALSADVRVQFCTAKKAADIKKKLAQASPDAIRQLRLRFFRFQPFQRVGGTDEYPLREPTTAAFRQLSLALADEEGTEQPLLEAADVARISPDTPRRFDLPMDGPLVKGIVAKLLAGQEIWLVLHLRARIPEEALYGLRVEGAGIAVDVQPEMVISAIDAAASAL